MTQLSLSPAPNQKSRTLRQQMTSPSAVLHLLAILIGLALLLPLLYLILRTVQIGSRAIELLLTERTVIIIGNSLLLAVLVVICSLAISLPLAWLTLRTDLPGRRLWGVLGTLPLVIPSFVGSYALIAMMGPRGLLQGWLEPFGVERLPSIYGLPGALWALTTFTYPYLLLNIRSGFRNMDPSLEEAARNLGHNGWQSFWRVVLPSLRPSIAAGSLLVALYVLSDFGAVAMLRYNTFTRAIYMQYTSSFDRSLAALLALVLVVLTLAILVTARMLQGRGTGYRSSSGAARKQKEIALGKWRWPALLFCALIILNGLIIPFGVVFYWLVRGLMAGEALLPVWQALANSVWAALLAAVACAILALPVVYLSVRFPSKLSGTIYQSVYVGYGLPGIVVALSLVFFGANYLPILYQTLTMLVFAYVVRFLPQASGTVRSALLRISPRLEEASRSLGRGKRRTFAHITMPLLGPGIWSGMALVFLTTIKELPATLLLSPTGFNTLATQIWAATQEAFFARAAAPALILLVASGLSIFIILHQEERGA